MPTYEFQSDDGALIERDYPMAKAPKVGRCITVNGVKYRRLPPALTRPVCHDERHLGYTLPRKRPGNGMPEHPADHLGRYQFTGKRDRIEFEAKLNDSAAPVKYVYD